jgi:hypothetical protein
MGCSVTLFHPWKADNNHLLKLEIALSNPLHLVAVQQGYPVSINHHDTVLLELLKAPGEGFADCPQPRRQSAFGGFKLDADTVSYFPVFFPGSCQQVTAKPSGNFSEGEVFNFLVQGLQEGGHGGDHVEGQLWATLDESPEVVGVKVNKLAWAHAFREDGVGEPGEGGCLGKCLPAEYHS